MKKIYEAIHDLGLAIREHERSMSKKIEELEQRVSELESPSTLCPSPERTSSLIEALDLLIAIKDNAWDVMETGSHRGYGMAPDHWQALKELLARERR